MALDPGLDPDFNPHSRTGSDPANYIAKHDV